MNEIHDSSHETEPAGPTSLWGRLFNVFAAPGEVFEELKGRPASHANWLVPAVLGCLMGLFFVGVILSQPDLFSEIIGAQEAGMEKQVAAGNMTEQQAADALEMVRGVTRIMMPIMAVVGTFFSMIFFALLVWLLAAKILKGDVSFMKALEVVGLSWMIGILGGLVTLCLVLIKGTMAAGPSAAFFLETFDPASSMHQLMATANIFTVWHLAILSTGVSKVTGRSFGLAAGWIFGAWLIVGGGWAVISALLARMQG